MAPGSSKSWAHSNSILNCCSLLTTSGWVTHSHLRDPGRCQDLPPIILVCVCVCGVCVVMWYVVVCVPGKASGPESLLTRLLGDQIHYTCESNTSTDNMAALLGGFQQQRQKFLKPAKGFLWCPQRHVTYQVLPPTSFHPQASHFSFPPRARGPAN